MRASRGPGEGGADEAGGGERAGNRVPAVRYGAASFAGLGLLLGGVAGTVDWPVVGTFFGAVEGAAAGATAGAFAGVAAAWQTRRRPSGLAACGVSGAVAAAGAGGAVWAYPGPIDVPRGVVAALVAAAVLLGAAFGPLIAFGPRCAGFGGEPVQGGRGPAAVSPRTVGRILAWGAGLGAAAGAVAGLVIGIRAYLPTSPVAAVEGAALGSVSGVVLAAMAALSVMARTAVLAPRAGARR